jgi:hypothetical protein
MDRRPGRRSCSRVRVSSGRQRPGRRCVVGHRGQAGRGNGPAASEPGWYSFAHWRGRLSAASTAATSCGDSASTSWGAEAWRRHRLRARPRTLECDHPRIGTRGRPARHRGARRGVANHLDRLRGDLRRHRRVYAALLRIGWLRQICVPMAETMGCPTPSWTAGQTIRASRQGSPCLKVTARRHCPLGHRGRAEAAVGAMAVRRARRAQWTRKLRCQRRERCPRPSTAES